MNVLAAVQAVEIGPAVDAEQHGLAIEDERAVAVAQRSLGDQREAIALVVAVARSVEQDAERGVGDVLLVDRRFLGVEVWQPDLPGRADLV